MGSAGSLGPCRFLCRLSALLIVVCIVLGPFSKPVGSHAQQDNAAPIDIAAILISPSDLEREGLAGYGLDYSQTFTAIDDALLAEPYAYSRGAIGLSTFPSARELLRDAGWNRMREQLLGVPEAVNPSLFAAAVASGIEEYASADGAAAAFDAMSEQRALESMMVGSVETMDTTDSFGDESGMWRIRGAAAEGTSTVSVTLWARVDNRIVGVSGAVFGGDAEPDTEMLESLMSRLLRRLDRAERTSAPGLSTQVLRLGGDQAVPIFDRYSIIDGEALARMEETEDELARREDEAADKGVLHEYYLSQRIADSPLRQGDDVHYRIWLQVYEDESAAKTRLAGTEERLREAEYEDLDISNRALRVGDEAIAYSYILEEAHVSTISVLVGDELMTVQISSTSEPVLDVLEELAEQQVACVEERSCVEPAPIPAALQ